MIVQIPLTNQPQQSFTIALPADDRNISLDFFIYWNRIAEYWQASITDPATGETLINGLPLTKGDGYYSNLLAQYEHLEIGQLYVIPTSTATTDSPGEAAWEDNFVLVWGP